VKDHALHAPGIYSNFRSNEVEFSTAIVHPEGGFVRIVNPFTVKLDNLGSILSIANGKGDATVRQGIPVRLLDLQRKL